MVLIGGQGDKQVICKDSIWEFDLGQCSKCKIFTAIMLVPLQLCYFSNRLSITITHHHYKIIKSFRFDLFGYDSQEMFCNGYVLLQERLSGINLTLK